MESVAQPRPGGLTPPAVFASSRPPQDMRSRWRWFLLAIGLVTAFSFAMMLSGAASGDASLPLPDQRVRFAQARLTTRQSSSARAVAPLSTRPQTTKAAAVDRKRQLAPGNLPPGIQELREKAAGFNRVDQNLPPGIKELREKATRFNRVDHVQNAALFPQTFQRLASDDVVVIVVMVHQRLDFLRTLLASLRAVRGIESAVLVISFDVYDDALLELMASIDFCLFIKLFFAEALQLHPNSFPGPSPNDCARDLTLAEARRQGCSNAETPDMYKHYRWVGWLDWTPAPVLCLWLAVQAIYRAVVYWQ